VIEVASFFLGIAIGLVIGVAIAVLYERYRHRPPGGLIQAILREKH
jgi:hypothetical protein